MKEFMKELKEFGYATSSAKDMLEYLYDDDGNRIKEILYDIIESESSLFQHLEDQENIWIDADFRGDYLDTTNAVITYYYYDDLWSLMKKYNISDVIDIENGEE